MQYVSMSQNHRNSKMAACKSQMQDLILIQHIYVHTYIYIYNKNGTLLFTKVRLLKIYLISLLLTVQHTHMLITQMNYSSK
jgi:hypothetical protein